jgi:hypothetical protein
MRYRAWATLAIVALLAGCGSQTKTMETNATAVSAKKSPSELLAEQKQKAHEAAVDARAEAARRRQEAREQQAAHQKEAREAEAKKLEEDAGNGLGVTKATFDANHDVNAGPEPPLGTAVYTVTSTDSAGRVTAYEVNIHASPPFSDRERIVLLSGVSLPNNAEIVRETTTCLDWRSPTLRRLIGTEYAQGSTESGTESAQMQAVVTPSC